ncbi:hypothetical protein LOK49_LG04G02508 [Camellia lanceoleosa]|uniref:Uncharacterized protein n=1 Tax=Camellia lanceoleosa TaxID=1840588 RepID=A0ACC0HV30_9ERIC|nr:hypothetical protein LOK49_LG04G02508 [Camellia lanceoleosa]
MADGLNTTPLAEISDEGSVVPSNNNNATSDPNSSPPPPALENSGGGGGNFDIDEAAQPAEPNINIRALIGSMVAQATSAASASINMGPFGDTVREVIVNYVVQPSMSSLGSEIIDHLFVQRQNFNRRVEIMLFFCMLLLPLQRFLSTP